MQYVIESPLPEELRALVNPILQTPTENQLPLPHANVNAGPSGPKEIWEIAPHNYIEQKPSNRESLQYPLL